MAGEARTVNLSRVGDYEFDNNYVLCPMCGFEQGDCWEWVTEQAMVEKCPGCGGTLEIWAESSTTYYTKAVSAPTPSAPVAGDGEGEE